MTWSDVAAAFRTTWENIFRSVEMAVQWGLQHRSLDGIESLGIDELYGSRREKYLTLVYQIDAGTKRLLGIGKKRTLKTLLRFFRWFGPKRSKALRFICSDMWKPYLRVVAKKAAQAIHVLDRFHIASHLSKAIDDVRAKEAKALHARGLQPFLTRTRWLLLKRPENLTPKQEIGLGELLLRSNLRSVRAYLLKEDIQRFWTYVSPYWAGVFLDRWCTRVMRSRLEPMKEVARLLRRHRELILNGFRARGQWGPHLRNSRSTRSTTGRRGPCCRTKRADHTRNSSWRCCSTRRKIGDSRGRLGLAQQPSPSSAPGRRKKL